jgi:hypothetical protein
MKRTNVLSTLTASLVLSALACRPVIAIGWTELVIIVIIILVLFAPLLLRLFRYFTRSERSSDKAEE